MADSVGWWSFAGVVSILRVPRASDNNYTVELGLEIVLEIANLRFGFSSIRSAEIDAGLNIEAATAFDAKSGCLNPC